MERDTEKCQGLEDISNVDFWATCYTDVEIWEAKVNEIFDKIKDLFSWRWHARVIRALIECIHNEVKRLLRREGENHFQALCQGVIIRLLSTFVAFQIKVKECVETMIGLSRKLGKNGEHDIAVTLFIFVSKITVEIGHGCGSRLA